jgi:hypothetical protein
MEPLEPVKIYPQRCFKCDTSLVVGDDAYAHVVNPVAICVKCAAAVAPEHKASLAKAVVSL